MSALVGPLNNGNNIAAVTVTSIQVGNSTRISGTLSTTYTSNSSGSSNQLSGLQNIFSSGKIAQMKILSYTLETSDGSNPTPNPNPTSSNLGLILGLCIPIGIISNIFILFLVILVVAFFVYRKYKSENIGQQSNMTNR